MPIPPESPDMFGGVYYPSSDGEPLGESDLHVKATILLYQALRDAVCRRPLHYVAADIFWYWEEGNPQTRCSPDVMVVRGVEDHPRHSFRSWQENNAVPCVVFEISSEETWQSDLNDKRELYAQRGVREYFLFDPEGLYLEPPLRGFRLDGGRMVEVQPAKDGSLRCEELGLQLRRKGSMLRLIEQEMERPILTREERIVHERRRAKKQRQRAEQAEVEVERLKQLLANLTQQKNGGSAK